MMLRSDTTKKCFYVIAVLLQILDGCLTYYSINNLGFGLDVEGNPIVKNVMIFLGAEIGMIIVKLLGCLGIYALYMAFLSTDKKLKRTSFRIILLLNLLYFFVVAEWVCTIIIHHRL